MRDDLLGPHFKPADLVSIKLRGNASHSVRAHLVAWNEVGVAVKETGRDETPLFIPWTAIMSVAKASEERGLPVRTLTQ